MKNMGIIDQWTGIDGDVHYHVDVELQESYSPTGQHLLTHVLHVKATHQTTHEVVTNQYIVVTPPTRIDGRMRYSESDCHGIAKVVKETIDSVKGDG